MAHRRFLPGSSDVWTIEIVGAEILFDLAWRRARPSEAPWAHEQTVAGLGPDGNGLVFARGRRLDAAPPYDLAPAVERLPPGTADVHPGLRPSSSEGSHAPVAGRGGALDRLSDESLGTPGISAGFAEDDALLFALRRWIPASTRPISGRLAAPTAAEVWRVETPLGVVVHLDRRGRLVSFDTQGSLHRAYGEACTTAAGRGLLGSGSRPIPGFEGMPFLPGRGSVTETRWGLAPSDPRFPLNARGRPVAVPDGVARD